MILSVLFSTGSSGRSPSSTKNSPTASALRKPADLETRRHVGSMDKFYAAPGGRIANRQVMLPVRLIGRDAVA